jgi:hypothetical protein
VLPVSTPWLGDGIASACETATDLNMQPDISHFKSGLLANINADEVGRVLVENVDMTKPKQEQLLADSRREGREEGHDGQAGPWSRCGAGKLSLPLRRGALHMYLPVECVVRSEVKVRV